jgi:hypothetical protein
MMATHQERARRMYGLSGSATAAKAAAPATPRDAASERLYGGSSDSYGAPISSYFDRHEAALRDDAEGLATSRLERQQVEAFARKRGIKSADLHDALSVVLEHEAHPKSPEVIQQRWNQAFEDLRLSTGGQEGARKVLDSYVALTSDLAKEVPSLADRAGRSGAANDIRVIKALAHYGSGSTPEEK